MPNGWLRWLELTDGRRPRGLGVRWTELRAMIGRGEGIVPDLRGRLRGSHAARVGCGRPEALRRTMV
jgi:hypothetical protein